MNTIKKLIAVLVVLLSIQSASLAQKNLRYPRRNVYVKPTMSGVYITLDRVGQVNSPEPHHDKERVWLRLHNNYRWAIRLEMRGVPTPEYGDAELFYDEFLNDELLFRNQCHVCTSNMLGSGKS